MLLALGSCASLAPPAGAQLTLPELHETAEIQWSSAREPDLLARAGELSTPVAIYEHVRNRFEYALYHGARSSSVNTFLGQRGNDVDLASVLIAIYR